MPISAAPNVVEHARKKPNAPGWLHSFLRRAGLVGKSLKLKLQYLANAAMNGWGKRLLDLLNKLLGSLAAVIHGTEAIKEFKEWLEGLLNEPDQDPGIQPIYRRAGYDPFCLATLL